MIRPDPKFDLTKIQINSMTVQMEIDQDDLKMITLSTDILNMEGTIYQLERTFSTSTEFEDSDQISTVDEVIIFFKIKLFTNMIQILSQVSADTNNMSRAVSIINDEEQRGWNLSLTDMDRTIESENEIVLEVNTTSKSNNEITFSS